MLGHRQHCGNFRLIGDALQGGCQRSKPGICALIRELDAQVVPQHLLVAAHAGRHAVADIGQHLPELEPQLLEFGRGIGDVAEHGSWCWLAPPTMPLDSSVWVEHLRTGLPRLAALLLEGRVISHPWVIGEIACGHLRNRREVIQLLQTLPAATS